MHVLTNRSGDREIDRGEGRLCVMAWTDRIAKKRDALFFFVMASMLDLLPSMPLTRAMPPSQIKNR